MAPTPPRTFLCLPARRRRERWRLRLAPRGRVVPTRSALLIAAAWLLVFGLGTASGQTLQINQERADLSSLIQQVGEATGRTILFDDSIRGTISVVAKRPVSLDEAWSMLDASLSILGFSLLPSTEGMWRIAKVADAIGESPFIDGVSVDDAGGASRAGSHRYVTSLIPLRVAEPAEVLAVLEPLAGASVTMVVLESSQAVIASGPERRIARLMTIADSLDRVEERGVRSRLLRYRQVSEVESWVEGLFSAGALQRRNLDVWTDERTNSLIYRGTGPEAARFRSFVDRFDLPVTGEGKIQVVPVLNRDAEEVATLLRDLGTPAAAARATGAPAASRTRLQENDYSISVDVPTRSLVVRADEKTQAAIRDILEVLDQPPEQVAVDLVITQVDTPSSFSLGFGFSVPLTSGDEAGEVLGRFVSNPGGGGFAATPSAETTVVGRVDQALNVPFLVDEETGLTIPIANTGVITAGDVEVRTDVLIEPSLVLTVGDQHEIFVGSNFPVPVTGDTGATSGDTNTNGVQRANNFLSRTTTFERRDVGIKIALEARAGKTGPIELDLDVELSQLAASIAGAVEEVGPTFTERRIQTRARLPNGSVGLIALNKDSRQTESEAGTPFLSSLPFLGWLFTNTTERMRDSHLILAARVTRVSSPSELVARTIRRRLAFQRAAAREGALAPVALEAPGFAVLVTTRTRSDDADAIAEGLRRRGLETEVHSWELRGEPVFDVYVRELETLAGAAEVANALREEGWEPDLTVLRRQL